MLHELAFHKVRFSTVKRTLGYNKQGLSMLFNDIGNFFTKLNSFSTFFGHVSLQYRKNYSKRIFTRKISRFKKHLVTLGKKFRGLSFRSKNSFFSQVGHTLSSRNYLKFNKMNKLFLLNSVNLNKAWTFTNFLAPWKSLFSQSISNFVKSPL